MGEDTGQEDLRAPGGAEPSSLTEPTYMDNPKAAGAPAGWKWGYLPCGCRNDGYGRHHLIGGAA